MGGHRMEIGFIGIGVMGSEMVKNLLKKGFTVYIYTRTKEKALDVIREGAIWCEDVPTCVKNRDAIITVVGYPKDVEEVYFAPNGILAHAKKGAYLIDMTTTSPSLSEKIYAAAIEKQLFALDAPISGGDIGARNATLSIMIGGDKSAFDSCQTIFKALGTTIIHAGRAGCGQHTKMANQIAIAGCVTGVAEAIYYGKTKGLDVTKMLASISTGAAGSFQMNGNGKKMVVEDYAPGFFIKHFIKDMEIAAEESNMAGIKLPVLEEVLTLYRELAEQGKGDLGTQAIFAYYNH